MTHVEAVEPQHMRALRIANERRLESVAVKDGLRAGTISVAAALDDPSAGCLPVLEFLIALYRPPCGRRNVAAAKAFEILLSRSLWEPGLAPLPSRRVRDLTERQRGVLLVL
jgi:hypothetical protein